MKRLAHSVAIAAALGLGAAAQAQEDITITLVPGLTTDAFYITMNRGAQAAGDALGITVDFQGAEEFDPVLQTPVLDAVIARGPGRHPDRADRLDPDDRAAAPRA
jgi:ribose transport system substrate-binding protein